MIDLHCHVLAGIDDGPKTIEGSLALARAAAESGVSTLVATPHVSWRYPNDAETITRLVDELNGRLAAERVALDVRTGAEVAMSRVAEIAPSELSRLRLAGGEWLLLEPPFAPVAPAIEAIVSELQQGGNRILLAHPERCPAFHRDPRILNSLVASGVLTSITAGSLVGRFGSTVRRFALKLMQEALVHNVASDAHDLAGRAPGIREELEQAGFAPLREWLTEAVPDAILNSTPIPPRPRFETSGSRPGRGRWRLRR